MDIYKTGKFIAEKRKEQGLTQKALAEKVGVTDKAISKWERGLSYPDISLLLSLAECLNVTVTEILNGNSIEEMKMELSDDILITSTRNYVQYAKSKSRRNTLLVSLILLIFLTCITFLAYRQNEIAKNNKAIDIVFTDLLCEMEVSFEYGREFLQYESVDAAKQPRKLCGFWKNTARFYICITVKTRIKLKKALIHFWNIIFSSITRFRNRKKQRPWMSITTT